MTVTLNSVLISNRVNTPGQSGLPTISGSPVDPLTPTLLFSVWGNTDYSYDVTVSLNDDSEGASPPTLTGLSLLSKPTYLDVVQVSPTVIRLKRNTSVVFVNEKYRYVSFDNSAEGSVVELNPEEAPDTFSIVEWIIPPVRSVVSSISMQASYTTNGGVSSSGSLTLNFTQSNEWLLNISLAKFETEISRSRW